MATESVVLNQQEIKQKTERIALEILENYFEEERLYIVGIEGNGFIFAERITAMIGAHSDLKVELLKLRVNKKSPLSDAITCSVDSSQLKSFSAVLVDDVINSGSTLIHAVRFLIMQDVKSLKVATLVNRTHRKFPVLADFVGIDISTTLQDHIRVEFGENEVAYLV